MKLFSFYWFLSSLFFFAYGSWNDPPFVEVPNGLEGITYEGGIITIRENVGKSESNGFALVQLNLIGDSHEIEITIGKDPRFSVQRYEVESKEIWYLNVSGAFDYEQLQDPQFYIVLGIVGGNEQEVLVVVADINEEPRIVSQKPDPVPPIPELEERTEFIVNITAVDDDKDDKLTFSISEDDGDQSFSITEEGLVFLVKELNYTQKISHRLNILITDSQEPQCNATTTIIVNVVDIPNSPPQFTRLPMIRAVQENTPINTIIGTVQARDGDYGLRWPVEYYINDDTLELFKIEKDTGEIKVAKPIDAEDASLLELDLTYSFNVTAKEKYNEAEFPDLPQNVTEFSVKVSFAIMDVNDQPPRICTEKNQNDDSCVGEVHVSFEIPENYISQISFKEDHILRVIDLDPTTYFNRFTADFADDTEDIILRAFSINPKRGMHPEEFFIFVNQTDAIDFENGEWHENGIPVSKTFTIEFTGTNNSAHIARAIIDVKVTDVNDERPNFEKPLYEFSVCENTEQGESLWHVVPNPKYPNSCLNSTKQTEIAITATDGDVTPSFGSSSIIYRWRTDSANTPPITLGLKNGTMTMHIENGNGFDYERLQTEVFTAEAVDSEGNADGLVATVPIQFKILDRNDENVELKFENGYRVSVEENTKVTVLTGIKATDRDETGNITFSMSVVRAFTKVNSLFPDDNNLLSRNYKQFGINSELADKIEKWFSLEELDGSSDKNKEFQIVVGEELPDREGYGLGDVDLVDLMIRVEDVNSEYEIQEASQIVTITIEDANDNPPERPEGEASDFRVNVAETEWGDEGDTSSDNQRVIDRLGVIDKDLNTTFQFSLSSKDCELDDETKCNEILDMFELSVNESRAGFTILRRKKGKVIDRENRELFKIDSDLLMVTVLASDGNANHVLATKFEVTVDDRNDNTPQFEEDYSLKRYTVDENVDTSQEIVQILATDADHPDVYGKVSYLLDTSGIGIFDLNQDNGKLTAIPGAYEWSERNFFRLEVKAIDYYRASSSSGSNVNTTNIQIEVIDKNNHEPEFRTEGGSNENPFLDIGETEHDNEPILATLDLRDNDNPDLPNGKITVIITDVKKQPPSDDVDLKNLFNLELTEGDGHEKKCNILSTRSLKGLWGDYIITIKASDGADSDPEPLSSTRSYFLRVKNENWNAPEFVYPENNDTSIHLSILNTEPNKELVDLKNNETIPNIQAVDKDAGSGQNGEVNFRFSSASNPDCMNLFQIDANSGMITLKEKLQEVHANKRCEMIIQAFDLGSSPNSDYAKLTFILLWDKNTPPQFASLLFSVNILENSTVSSSSFPRATDADIENGNIYFPNETIFYFLKGGASNLFQKINEESQTSLKLEPKEGLVLDREEVDLHRVSIYCTNDVQDQVEDRDPEDILNGNDAQWAVVEVTVDDLKDTAPTFVALSKEGYITGGFSTNTKTDEVVGNVEAKDEDIDDYVTFEITSGFQTSNDDLPNDPQRPPFQLIQAEQENKAVIKLQFDAQPYFKGHYSFNITATDSVGYTAEAEVRIYIVASTNSLNFYFTNERDDLMAKQVALAGILSEVFRYQCNVDRVFINAAVSQDTTVETHFINTSTNLPVPRDIIRAQQFKPVLYTNLVEKLKNQGFTLTRIGESDPIPESNIDEIITYVLIGGVAVLVIALLVLATTCFYNNKGLQRKVRALTANTFGSQQSDLNRLGVTSMDAPNTNTFAVEGSNPIWTVHSDARKMPEFDTESVGSGGSVLIGAEDEDYFKKSSQNPMFQADDVVAEYDYENDNYEMNFNDDDDEPEADIDIYLAQNSNNDTGSSPFTSRTTKNTLVTLGETEMSDDVDDYGGDESYQFEGNTDVSLF